MIRASASYTSEWGSFVLLKMDRFRVARGGSLSTLQVYRDKGTPPKKGGGSSFTVTKLPSSLEPKGQRPLSLPHSP